MDALGQTGCSYLQLVPNVQLGKNLHRTPGNCMLGLALMTEGLGLGAELTADVPDNQTKIYQTMYEDNTTYFNSYKY